MARRFALGSFDLAPKTPYAKWPARQTLAISNRVYSSPRSRYAMVRRGREIDNQSLALAIAIFVLETAV